MAHSVERPRRLRQLAQPRCGTWHYARRWRRGLLVERARGGADLGVALSDCAWARGVLAEGMLSQRECCETFQRKLGRESNDAKRWVGRDFVAAGISKERGGDGG